MQKAFQTYRENSSLFLQVSLALAIILAGSMFVGAITGTFILFIFILLPLLVSIFAIAMKASTNQGVTNRDLYFGYKNFGTSLVLATKLLMKPILISFLVYFGVSIIGYPIIIMQLKAAGDPAFDIIMSGDFSATIEALSSLT